MVYIIWNDEMLYIMVGIVLQYFEKRKSKSAAEQEEYSKVNIEAEKLYLSHQVIGA